MKVLVDGRSLLPLAADLGPTGVGRWTRGVIGGLSRVAPDWEIVVAIVTRDEVTVRVPGDANVRLEVIRWPERWFRRSLVLGLAPRVTRHTGTVDAMVGPGFVTWPGAHAEIPVIHDLAFVKYPSSVQSRNLAYLRLMVPRVLKRAAAVVTVSETMSAEIAQTFGVDRERIRVVPNAVDPFDGARGETGIAPGYLLFVGTYEPRKNLSALLDAYALLRSRGEAPPLVIAGGPGWRGGPALESRAAATPGVIPLGYVDDERLAALYRDAAMLVFPSLYEGFGLPIVEAMSAGTPVVTSARGGTTDAGGDAVLYVDPEDPADIAHGIDRVLRDADLAARLRELGRARAASFTWASSAAALKRTLEAVT